MTRGHLLKVCGQCFSVSDILPFREDFGTEHSCHSCKARYMAGTYLLGTVYHVIHVRGKIEPGDGAAGLWQIESSRGKKMVYVGCPNCASIHEIDPDDVDSEGYVEGKERGSCITCTCALHFWPYLEGWRKEKKSMSDAV